LKEDQEYINTIYYVFISAGGEQLEEEDSG